MDSTQFKLHSYVTKIQTQKWLGVNLYVFSQNLIIAAQTV